MKILAQGRIAGRDTLDVGRLILGGEVEHCIELGVDALEPVVRRSHDETCTSRTGSATTRHVRIWLIPRSSSLAGVPSVPCGTEPRRMRRSIEELDMQRMWKVINRTFIV